MSDTYVWYSPKRNRILIVPIPECREYKSCRWDKCAMFFGVRPNEPFFFMGEL